MPRTYYAVLRVSHGVTSSAMHNAFRSLARQYHPDSGPGSSPDKFCEIAEAYYVLRDPERRRQYDLEIRRERSMPK
jgi:curved DNA-binding protein CbpA